MQICYNIFTHLTEKGGLKMKNSSKAKEKICTAKANCDAKQQKYSSPDVEVMVFANEDIITSSLNMDDDGWTKMQRLLSEDNATSNE